MAAHADHTHDPKTLEAALAHTNKHRTKPIKEAICDRGYRGKKEVDGIAICISGTPLKRDEERRKYAKLYLLFFRLW